MIAPSLLAALWALAVLAAVVGAGRVARTRGRVVDVAAVAAVAPASVRPDRRVTIPTWVGAGCFALARAAARRAGPRVPRGPADERWVARLGGAVVGAAPLVVLAPRFAPLAALVGALWPAAKERRARRSAAEALARALPETADLLVLAVGAGLNIPLALAAVARRAEGPVAVAIGDALAEVAAGRRLADALHDLPARHGEVLRPLTAALESSERYGTPLLTTLERLAAEVRLARRRRAEEVARRLPVKLLFPLVTCTLPAFGLLTVAPLLASGLRSLRLQP